MKKFLTFLLIAALAACSKSEDGGTTNPDPTPEKPKAEIKLNTSSSYFTADGGRDEISFSSTEAWTAEVINSRADGWCDVSPTSGDAGEATITISTKPNDTPDERNASVRIKAGSASKTISVSQKQKDALTVTASKFEVEAEGGEVKIEVKANIDFEYAIDESAKEWIKYEGTRAMKTSTLTFKVAENFDTEKREGKITIKSGEFNEVVTIYQAGSEPSIVISQNEYVVSSDGETISVEVSSNVDVVVEMPADADWISENTTRATSTNTYRFDIQPNEAYDQRSTEIKFTNKENKLSEVVKVTQVQKDALVVAKESYTVDSDGGQLQIEVGHNVDFDIEISNDWITKAENTRAFVTETLNFNIAKNPTTDNREGTIVFKSKDGKLSQTVKVYQAQEDALIISKKDIVVSDEGGTISFELQTNVEFTVSEPDVDWLRPVTTRALTTHTLNYTVDANTSYNSREAHIVVTNTKTNASETITITQAQKDAIVLAKDSYTVESDGGQIEIEVGHNVDFDIEISADWITKVDTRAFVTETLVFNIAKNPTTDNREGTIIFKSKDGAISQTVKVYQAQEDALIISKKDIVVSDEGGTISFELQTNVEFKVSEPDVDWLRPVVTRGLTTHTLHYEYDANSSYDSREAHIVVTNTKTNASETITITQTQKDAIVLAKDNYTVDSDGGQIEIEVGHNVDFDIEISADWITKAENTRAFVTETLVFNIAKNPTTDNREGTIIFKSKDGKLTQTVKVYQAQEDALIISKKDIVVSDEGGIISFELQTNVEFTVSEPDVDWLRPIVTRGLTTHTLHYEYDANSSYDSREAHIVVTNTKTNASETITITQAQKDAIVLAKDSYTVESDGGQLQIEVGHNIDFDIEISADWITKAENTRAFVTESIVFNIAKNPTTDNREGTIIFKSKDGAISQTVKVYQAQEDALIISKKDIVVSDEGGTISFELQTNVEFTVSEPDVDWLRPVVTRGLTTHTLHYEYDANSSYDSREAHIVVTNTKTNASETITITQAQKDAIVLAKDSYTVESDGGQIEIEVGHNIDFDIEISADWITKAENTRAFATENLIFNIAPNALKQDRTGTIKIHSLDNTISHTITILQKRYSSFDPSIGDWGDGGENGGTAE